MIDGAEPLTEPLKELTTADLVAILARTAEAMAAHAPGLDAIDVIPSPDGDTGANLTATATALAGAAGGATTSAGLAGVLATVVGPAGRGRSGAMLAEFMAGWTDAVRNADRVDAERFALALEAGAERARGSVRRPIEGTMLTVMDAAADRALAVIDAGGSLAEVLMAANDGGLDALELTSGQLPELAAAGVVDAGAAGWLVWLDVVLAHVCGDDDPVADLGSRPDGGAGPRWAIRFRIRCDRPSADRLGGVFESLGDLGGFDPIDEQAGLWSVVVLADDIGAVIEAALSAGRPFDIRVDQGDA